MHTEAHRNLNNYILDLSVTRIPLNLSEIFNNQNDNTLEIGFGDGEFLTNMALKKRSNNFVGLEIKRYRFLKAVRIILGLNLRNIKFIHIDAVVALSQIFKNNSFTNIYINFPDPWPKLKHHKHRIFNTDLLLNLNYILEPKGNIYISSDHEEYILNIINVFKNINKFRLNALLKWTPDTAGISKFKTRFEHEFITRGKDIYYLNYMKT